MGSRKNGVPLRILLYPYLLNLYDHPNAGLLWDKYQDSKVVGLGFEKFSSWECLHVLLRGVFFFAACDDDYKIISQAKDVGPMRAAMRTS